MSQNIECTECHDLVSIEGGRTVSIPFICQSCTSLYEPSSEGEPDMVTKVKTTFLTPEIQQALTGEAEVLTIDYEAINNAITGMTLATQDAERLKKELADLTEYVSDIEIQLQNSRQETLMSDLRAKSLAADNEFINQQNTEVTKQASQLRQDLKVALGIAARLA